MTFIEEASLSVTETGPVVGYMFAAGRVLFLQIAFLILLEPEIWRLKIHVEILDVPHARAIREIIVAISCV